MAKDFAVLFNIDKWLKSTADMDADVRGWYVNLLLHQYDKNGLPNDIEQLALLAVVKFSDFKRFEQVFEQVLKHKFEQAENGRLYNPTMFEIMMERNDFKTKRSIAGKISYILRKFREKEEYCPEMDDIIKELITPETDVKSEHVFEHLFKICSERLISIGISINTKPNNTTQAKKTNDDYAKDYQDSHTQLENGIKVLRNNNLRQDQDNLLHLLQCFVSAQNHANAQKQSFSEFTKHFTNWIGTNGAKYGLKKRAF